MRSTRPGDAPSAAATCRRRGSSPAHMPPTVRTTTAILKNASAATTTGNVPSIPRKPSGPVGITSDANATPTTTDGSTKGMVTMPRTISRPGKRVRYSTHAHGSPSSSETTVPAVAWARVVATTRAVRGAASTEANPSRVSAPSGNRPRASRAATG